MTTDLQKKLKSRWGSFTTSEQKIASYMLRNIAELPFETAASLGKHVDVSAMTVGRFLRNLGYSGLGELKDELRGSVPLRSLYNNPQQFDREGAVSGLLQADIRGLTAAHALTRTDEWTSTVNLLVAVEHVAVASFFQARFLGMGFAGMLAHVKPRTSFVEGQDGAYADVLLEASSDTCVVLIDFRRYWRHFRLLAEEVAARGLPLVIITDTECYWARQLTEHLLMLPIDNKRPWHNFSAATSLLSLLVGAVQRQQDDTQQENTLERIGEITQLRQKFVGYVEAPTTESDRVATKAKPSRKRPPAAPNAPTRARKKRPE